MVDHHVTLLAQLLKDIKSTQPKLEDPTVVAVDHGEPVVDVAKIHDVEVPATVTAKNIFRHPDAHPLVLDLLLIGKYGEDWLGWESDTIGVSVPTDFGVDRISDLNIAKIQAMKTLHLVDSFWQRWEVFNWCAMPITSTFPDFEVMQVPTVLQCACAVDVANRVRNDMVWSDEVKVYLALVHKHDGILVPQPPLDFVSVDTSGLPVDIDDIAKRWAMVRSERKAPTESTPEDEQLRRMLDLFWGLEQYRARMRQQLEIVHHD